MGIRVLLVDDQPVVRAGFRTVLTAAGGLDVVGEAADGPAELVVAASTVKTHVAALLRKLDRRDRVRLVVHAFSHGLVPARPA